MTYDATDTDSGVAYVELWYRRNGGAWEQYGGQYTTSPIVFNTSATGGDGWYEFYTVAVDNAGNREAAPDEPSTSTAVVTSFAGTRIYVDIDATGTRSGVDWANAFHAIGTAIGVAQAYSVNEIWVAEGAYYGSTVTIPSGVWLYGGFAGLETELGARDWTAHVTTIHGVGADAVMMESTSDARLDGFTVTSDSFADGIVCGPNVASTVEVAN